jgi:intracellular multiplication protein IcmG
MAADKGSEDEYQYPEDEYVQAQAEPQVDYSAESTQVRGPGVSSGGLMGKIQSLASNRIFIIVLIVVILFIVIRIVTTHHKSSTKTASTPAATATTTAATPPVTQTVSAPTPSISEPSPQTENELTQLKQMAAANQSSIQSIEQQLSQVQTAINSLGEDRGSINEAVSQLAIEFKQLAASVKKKKTKKPSKKKTAVKPVVYYLRAVVPGRAWIYGTNGRSASIALGDSVKQYGKVLAINAPKGEVLTSSGKIIEFSSTDR